MDDYWPIFTNPRVSKYTKAKSITSGRVSKYIKAKSLTGGFKNEKNDNSRYFIRPYNILNGYLAIISYDQFL